jgi:uncharacterized membrane protein YbhN (UPF0104 family)
VAGVPKRLSIAAHFSGLVANLGLPSVSGGDIVRAAVVFRHASHRAPVALASVADRMIDFVALLVLSFTGLLLAGPRAGDPVLVLRFVALVMTVSLVAGALAYLYLRRRPLPPMLVRVVAATEVLLSRPGRVLVALGVSCLVQTTLVVLNWQLGRAVGVQVGLDVWLLAWPLAKLVALVPISLAGLGVREASLIGLMRPFGVPAGGIVAAGLLWHSVLVTGGPVGLALARLFTLRPRIQPQGAIAP